MNTVQEFISITPWTSVFAICNLLILVAILKKFLFKPVTRMLEARQKEIDDLYAQADENRSEAENLREEYQRRMHGAREEADSIVRSAVDNAHRRGEQILSEADRQAQRARERAEEEIDQERRRAFGELQSELGDMAVRIASKVVGREINPDDQQALIDEFIQDTGEPK